MSGVDTLVLGSGPDGLVAATLLAKAGRKVTVLEPGALAGGPAAGADFGGGFHHAGVLHHSQRLRPWVVKELSLAAHGLALRDPAPVFAAQAAGAGKLVNAAEAGEGYARWRAFVDKVRPFVDSVLDAPPPVIGEGLEVWPLARTALGFRRLGERTMMELLRVGPLNAEDWLAESIDDPLVRAAIAGVGLRGAWMGPLSPSGATMILLDACASGQEVVGGPAALVRALLAAASAAGVTVRTDADVARIRVERGGVAGVTLRGGEALDARLVLSTLDPRTTLESLVRQRDLPPLVEKDLHTIRRRGIQAKVHLGLRGKLRFQGRPSLDVERAWVGEHPHDLERAFDDARHRRMPRKPPLDLRIFPGPDGGSVVSALLTCAAFDLDGGWTDARREALGDLVVDALERVAPGTRDQVAAREVLTPADLEARYRLGEGQLYGAEYALEQLYVMRPTLRLARYASGVRGLFLGGPGNHPGGGVCGGSGGLAAKAALAAV